MGITRLLCQLHRQFNHALCQQHTMYDFLSLGFLFISNHFSVFNDILFMKPWEHLIHHANQYQMFPNTDLPQNSGVMIFLKETQCTHRNMLMVFQEHAFDGNADEMQFYKTNKPIYLFPISKKMSVESIKQNINSYLLRFIQKKSCAPYSSKWHIIERN